MESAVSGEIDSEFLLDPSILAESGSDPTSVFSLQLDALSARRALRSLAGWRPRAPDTGIGKGTLSWLYREWDIRSRLQGHTDSVDEIDDTHGVLDDPAEDQEAGDEKSKCDPELSEDCGVRGGRITPAKLYVR